MVFKHLFWNIAWLTWSKQFTETSKFKASCGKKVKKESSKEFENIITGTQFDINKYNQKLTNIFENQKI